jgi:DNA (cytosine-5)-methyltransferase 1
MLTVGSLFAGIGGIELGLERTGGFRTVWQVERDEFARRVLAKHWSDVRRHDDVRTFPAGDPDQWRCDLICGGFPCQDISLAGSGAGLAGTRSGLWFEYARIIRELRPRFVLVENVAALLTRGLGRVLGDLAEIGYDAEWSMLPACALGAPHTRQ